MTAQTSRQMAKAAVMLLDSLDSTQHGVVCRPFPDDEERRLWFYAPLKHCRQ
jgi:hypothetical protein